MNTFRVHLGVALAAGLVLPVGSGCGLTPESLAEAARRLGIVILGVEQLSPPAVPEAGVYKPDFTFDIITGDPSAGRAAGFFLTAAMGRPSELTLRLIDRQTGVSRTLTELSPPADLRTLEAGASWELEPAARDALAAGEAVYWPVEEATGSAGTQKRLAVAIPQGLLAPLAVLEVFSLVAPDGTPLGADRIELVQDFFYMAVIGDSVVWGNGLPESDKFSTLVAEEVQRRLGKRVIRQVHAISGTRIVPAPEDVICRVSCNGEVQSATTSITAQVDLIRRPELVDLILMDGCSNDVELATILDPATTQEEVTERTASFCGEAMIGLLGKVRATAPQAKVIVTGYFPIVSLETDLPALVEMILAQGAEPGADEPGIVERVATNSTIFFETSRASLSGAVDAVNAGEGGPPMIRFVDPAFGPANALLASDPWVWGLKANGTGIEGFDETMKLFPEDPLADIRGNACLARDVLAAPIICLYASVGHPNVTGARTYATAIISGLEALGVLPPAAAP